MFNNKRSGTETTPIDSSATYIGTDVQIEGTLRGKGVLRIEGKVTGQIEHEGTVVVGTQAEVHAKVRVRELVIQGFVEGAISAERCELAETARVNGEIRAQKLSVAEGATLSGDMAANQPVKSQAGSPGEAKVSS